jgi:hypothetical protein
MAGILRWVLAMAAFSTFLVASSLGQTRYAGNGPGSLVAIGVIGSGYQLDYGHRHLAGVGAYADFNLTWRLGIEGEARLLRYHQEDDTHVSTYLIGPRLSFGKHRLNPYGKVLVGLGKFNFPFNYGHGSYFVVAPGAGVDYRINRRVRLRLVDFEYQEWPQFTFGAMQTYGLSTGISFTLLRSGTRRSD